MARRPSKDRKLRGVDTSDLGDTGTAHTDPLPKFDDATDDTDDAQFSTLEEGLGGFVPDWDNDETTDFGRTGMRVPDSEQQTRLHGRAFDEMRQVERAKHTPVSQPAQIIIEEDGPGSSVLVAGVGVLGAMIATALALLAMLLLLVWFGLRTRPVVVVEGPDNPEVTDGGSQDGTPGGDDGVVDGGEDPDEVADPDPKDGTGDEDPGDGGAAKPAPAPAPAPPAGQALPPTRFPADFAFNQWTPRNVDRALVGTLVGKMKRCASVIVLTGHTDGVGSDVVNERFAIARAAAVRDLIAEAGVEKNRMVLASAFDGEDAGAAGRRVDVSCP